MTIIFRSYSEDGASLRLSDAEPGHLTFNTSGFAQLEREAVLRLHLTLGEWLHPQNLGPTNGQIAAAIDRLADAMNGAAAAVRPLWGPRGQYIDAHPGGEGHTDGLHVEESRVTTDGRITQKLHRPQECPGAPDCTEGTPEPQDAATAKHAQPEGCKCGHGLTRHGITGCFVRHCRCTKGCSGAQAPAIAPECTRCGHGHEEHDQGIRYTACQNPECTCTRYRSAP